MRKCLMPTMGEGDNARGYSTLEVVEEDNHIIIMMGGFNCQGYVGHLREIILDKNTLPQGGHSLREAIE